MSALFQEMRQDPHGDLKGVMVVVDGRVVREAYFNGDGPTTLHDMRSAGKSITSLLVGIAVDRGAIRGVDRPVLEILGAPPGTGLAEVTLRDLLTMRTGLAADDTDPASAGNEARMDASSDWLAFALGVPRARARGQTYLYGSVNAFLAGAVVEKATGTGLQDFATRHLFTPLGITEYRWRRGPRGEGAGQGNLELRLRDAARIGELVLGGGTLGGERIVSRRWIAGPRSRGWRRPPSARGAAGLAHVRGGVFVSRHLARTAVPAIHAPRHPARSGAARGAEPRAEAPSSAPRLGGPDRDGSEGVGAGRSSGASRAGSTSSSRRARRGRRFRPARCTRPGPWSCRA